MKFDKNRLFSLLSALICLIISKILATPDFTTKYLSSDKHIEVNTLKMIQSLHILMIATSFLLIVTIFIPIHKIKIFFKKNVFLTIPLIFIVLTVIVSVLFFCGSYGLLLPQSILYALLITTFFSLFLLKDKISYFNKITFVLLIGIALRILTSLLFFGTYDVGAYMRFYRASELGANIYLTTDYNYFPAWLWILNVIGWISKFFNISFFIAVKYPTIIADIFIFFIIFLYLKHQKINQDNIFLILSGFFLNPLSIMVSSYHNQFCNISILFLLLACYSYSLNTNKEYAHGILIGISMAIKHFTLFCIPIIFFRYKKLWSKFVFLLLALVIPIITVLYYLLTVPNEVIHNIFKYVPLQGEWGVSIINQLMEKALPGISSINPIIYKIELLIMLIVIVFIAFKTRFHNIIRSTLMVFLSFYVFTPGFGIQYLIWILPFAAILQEKHFKYYTIFGSLSAFGYYYSWPIKYASFAIFGLFTWIICIVWLIDNLKKTITVEKNNS